MDPWHYSRHNALPPRIGRPGLLPLEDTQALRCLKVSPRTHTWSKEGPLAHRYASLHRAFLRADSSPGNYHQLFRDALRYNLDLVEKYGGAVKINALLGVMQLTPPPNQVAHTTTSTEPTALHIRPPRSPSRSRQGTAHLHRNGHVHHVRSTLPVFAC